MTERRFNNGDGAVMNITGMRSGRLVAVSISKRVAGKGAYWLCKCDCGKSCIALGTAVKNGKKKSCGLCSMGKKKHGLAHTREYRIWIAVKTRCYKKTCAHYVHYGGRGIRACKRWMKFENFLADMGKSPSLNHSIDRIDVNGNYEPNNCRWATHEQQQNNRRNSICIEVDGQKNTISGWARNLGVSYHRIHRRYYSGWNHEAVIYGKAFKK